MRAKKAAAKNKGGRPALPSGAGKDVTLQVRLKAAEAAELDAWCARQAIETTRSQAVRYFIKSGLTSGK